jgi:hypothetical protein
MRLNRYVNTSYILSFLKVSALIALPLAWVVHFAEQNVHARVAEVERRIPKKLTIRGAMIDLDAVTQLASAGPAGSTSAFSRHLVLMFEKDCPFCRRNLPRWEELLGGEAWPPDTDLWLLSLKPDLGSFQSMATPAADRHIPFRVLLPTNGPSFRALTGLSGPPTTFLLSRGRIDAIGVGAMTEGEVAWQRFRTPFVAPLPQVRISRHAALDKVV